jgi:hypothetical protein
MSQFERRKKNKADEPKSMASALESIEQIDSSIERRFLIASIISDEFCEAIDKNSEIVKNLLPSKASKMIFSWASEFYTKYNRAIKGSLANLYQEKEENIEDELADDLKEVLSDINSQYKRNDFNWEFEFDHVKTWLDSLNIESHNEEIEALNDLGRHKDAIEMVESFNGINWGDDLDKNKFDPFDEDLIRKAIEERIEPLFPMPGDLGEFFGPALNRKSFIMGIASAKVGKSFLLNLIAQYASAAGLNVLRIECGDISEEEAVIRSLREVCKKPINDRQDEFYIPKIDCKLNALGQCNLPCGQSLYMDDADGKTVMLEPSDVTGYITCNRCQYDKKCADRLGKEFVGSVWREKYSIDSPMTVDSALKDISLYKRRRVGNTSHYNFLNFELTPKKLTQVIKNEEKLIGKIDVVIPDYFGIMSCDPEYVRESEYKQITRLCAGLRNVAKAEDLLIFTMDQSNVASTGNPIMNRTMFSDNKSKLDYCTQAFGMQRLTDDVKYGGCRLQQLISRTSETLDEQLVLLQSIGTGHLNLGSYLAPIEELVQNHPSFKYIKQEREEKEAGR